MKELSRRDFLKDAGYGLGALFMPKWALNFENRHIPEKFSDVLNIQTQEALATKAASLISLTPEAAINTANKLRNSTQSSAENICGPLAIEQLLHTVISGVKPEDYWLATPTKNGSSSPTLFSQSFPEKKFDCFQINTSIAGYDFDQINLQPGDFLYLFGYKSGSDHMITVSRRDENGILYCLTNYPQADGRFIIEEVPLWNPKDKDNSFMKKFAKSDNSVKFSTGSGGFMLWRLKEQQMSSFDCIEHTPPAKNLQNEVEKLVKDSQGNWHILISNLDNNKLIAESGSRISHYPASVIKVPIAMALMSQLESEAKDEQDLKDIINNYGYQSRNFNQLLSAMLVKSEEDAATKITNYLISRQQNTQKLINSWGAPKTTFIPQRSTAEDTQCFFSHIYDFKTFKYLSTHQYLLNLLSQKTSGDATRLGTLSNFGIKIDQIYNKRDLIVENGTIVVADSGIVRIKTDEDSFNKKSFFISLTGMPKQNSKITYETLEGEIQKFIESFAKYCQYSKR